MAIEEGTLEAIGAITKELLKKLEIEVSPKVSRGEEESVEVEIEIDDPQMLIGEKGQTLLELQHLLRLMVRKKLGEAPLLVLDINEYRKSRETYLRELANTTADEVALLKKEKELPAMSAQDRRIVHMVIAERQDVVSESVGEDPERRIVIKVKESENPAE
ncbi:MAG: R3H domain-containing nucleic acid-binding protein [bacterium]|nr:R3H domain-containing nucleic acid-binding protein [bacterium]